MKRVCDLNQERTKVVATVRVCDLNEGCRDCERVRVRVLKSQGRVHVERNERERVRCRSRVTSERTELQRNQNSLIFVSFNFLFSVN